MAVSKASIFSSKVVLTLTRRTSAYCCPAFLPLPHSCTEKETTCWACVGAMTISPLYCDNRVQKTRQQRHCTTLSNPLFPPSSPALSPAFLLFPLLIGLQVQLFFHAIQELNFERAFEFIDHGVDVNAIDGYNKTALHHAAKGDNEYWARRLLDKKANVDARDSRFFPL